VENDLQLYKKELSNYLAVDASQVFLFWKGRVALYAILKALGISKGDEVILPAFTCVVVPNAIIYLGATPVYVDIEPATFNIDTTKISSRITKNTKAILAQNTFGLSPYIDSLRKIAGENNLALIEDCAHGFGGTYNGKPNGTTTKAAFFSTQWNKPFSTGIGGMAIVQDAALSQKVSAIEQSALRPAFTDEMKLKAIIAAKKYLMHPAVYWPAMHLYRWLSMKGIVIGSSSKEEIEDITQPENFLMAMTATQARKGRAELKRIDGLNAHRKATARQYADFLSTMNNAAPAHAEHTFLKYPLLVTDREKFMAAAEAERIEIGDWFLSPLHPVKENLERWNYQYGSNPIAEHISKHIVNLPTHELINDKELQRIFAFLESNKNLLMR
jgi:perosamine synthetase